MKKTLGLFLLVALLAFARSSLLSSAPVVAYIDSVNVWYGCNVPAAIGLPSGHTKGPNVIALSFWTTKKGADDATEIWANPHEYIPTECGFGSTKEEIQKNLLEKFHNNGIKLILSAFGAEDYPTNKDPTEVCTSIAKFVLENNLDGIDIDYEDDKAFEEGHGAQWVITCTQTLRKHLPKGKYILTHAPQGPYFTTDKLYKDGGYRTVDKQVGHLIDWYNLQYYNQGKNAYVSYEDCFARSSSFPGSSVLELRGLNSKVAVGKPATLKDAGNGWVDPSTLGEWLKKANKAGWCGGAMYWEHLSDKGGVFGSTVKNALASFSGCTPI